MTESSDAEKRFCPTLWWGFFWSRCGAHADGELQVMHLTIDPFPPCGSESDVTKLTDMILGSIGLFDVATQIEPVVLGPVGDRQEQAAGGDDTAGQGGGAPDDDVVDADFEEVKEDDKK